MQIRRVIAAGAIALILIPAGTVAVAYFTSVYPHIEDVRRIIRSEPTPPQRLYEIALSDPSASGISLYASQLMARRFSQESLLQRALWANVWPISFTDQESFKVWVGFSPYRHDVGLRSAAKHYFGMDVTALNDQQLAALVLMVRSPVHFEPGSRPSSERINRLLNEVPAASHSLQARWP